jgi:O-antigen ligase
LIVAVESTRNPRDAVGVSLALVLLLALAFQPVNLLIVLVVTLFADILQFGGLTIGRLIAPVALVVLVDAAVRRRLALPRGSPAVWALGYAIWTIASGLWSVSLGSTGFLLGSLGIALVYMTAFATLTDSDAELKRVLIAVSVASVAIGLLAILSFSFGVPADLSAGRSEGGTGDANLFAAYQIAAIPLVLVLVSEVARGLPQLLVYGGALTIIASVFTSVSRGGLVAMLVVAVTMVFIPARAMFRSVGQKVAVLLVIVVVGAVALQATSTALTARLSDKTGSGRVYEWKAAWLSVHQHPVLGLGYGAFPPRSRELLHQVPGVDLEKFDIGPQGEAVHNVYLGTLAELGIPGLVLFLGLLVSTGRTLRGAALTARRTGNLFLMRASNALLLSLVGVCVAALFLSLETSRALWVVVGLSLALARITRREAELPH